MFLKQGAAATRPQLSKSTAKKVPARQSRASRMASPDRVVTAIIDGIQTGAYRPGQRLIEADLTRRLYVSRGPVREAFKRLAAEGIVTLTRHRGAYICALTRAEAHDTLVVVEALFGLMANLAATRINVTGNAARMRTAFERLRAFKDDGSSAAYVSERHHFYDVISQIGGNRALNRVLPLMPLHLMRMQFQAYLTCGALQKQFEEYSAITQAILAGDAGLAEAAIRLHIRHTRVAHEALPDEAYPDIQS